jgi:hypothetical protein
MKRSLLSTTFLIALAVPLGLAQRLSIGTKTGPVLTSLGMPDVGSSARITLAAGSRFGPNAGGVVTGEPYSAQQESRTVRTLADRTHITDDGQSITYYRDSLGRTRTEVMPPPAAEFTGEGPKPSVLVDIGDPVAGYRYTLDSNSHTAYRAPLGALPPSASGAGGRGDATATPKEETAGTERLHPEISADQLGTQTIEGMAATGTRMTTIYPAGFFGNDRPITTVRETWMSKELGRPVLERTSDPLNGETTMRLTNISRSEPDSSLFQPPADYKVVDLQQK